MRPITTTSIPEAERESVRSIFGRTVQKMVSSLADAGQNITPASYSAETNPLWTQNKDGSSTK